MKVVLCPFAGGTKTSYKIFFKYWNNVEAMTCDYKGRNGRNQYRDFKNAVKDCLKQCHEFIGDDEYVIFGHSMGAFVAYEVAYQMQYIYENPPVKILISGEPSPDPEPCTEEFETDEELKEYLLEMGGTDERLLNDAEFLKTILARMRGDFHLLNSYDSKKKVMKLNTDMVWMYGDKDKNFEAKTVEQWASKITGKFKKQIFKGGHFYFYDNPKQSAEFIERKLSL
ncbi:MAG: alpha/beta fold hydrolase [Hespellia sp.]|nr:alpha/beta fold hydrolase [Hespellia sp.]